MPTYRQSVNGINSGVTQRNTKELSTLCNFIHRAQKNAKSTTPSQLSAHKPDRTNQISSVHESDRAAGEGKRAPTQSFNLQELINRDISSGEALKKTL